MPGQEIEIGGDPIAALRMMELHNAGVRAVQADKAAIKAETERFTDEFWRQRIPKGAGRIAIKRERFYLATHQDKERQ